MFLGSKLLKFDGFKKGKKGGAIEAKEAMLGGAENEGKRGRK